jgi:hypothetical protein
MARFLPLLALTLILTACSTGAGGARPPSPAATATATPAPADAPTATSGATGTSPLTVTPSPVVWPTPTPPVGCSQAEIADLLARFFAAHSRGDLAALRRFFPNQDSGTGGPDNITTHFQWFSVTEARPQQGRQHLSVYRLEDLWAYFAARQEQREWMQLTRVTVNEVTPDGVAQIVYALAREADDLPPHAMSGKGAVNCKDQTIIVWSMGPGAAPVLATRPATRSGTATRDGR